MSYLNTKPLLYGIEKHPFIDTIHLSIGYPSRIADMLVSGDIDIGLAPVSIIPRLGEYHINTKYCIGADGPVASVCIFSQVPIAKIDRLLLDNQSRTSVALAKILLRDYWKINPELVDGGNDFRRHIHGSTAGIVIGDRALEQRKVSPFVYDLGEAWKIHTGLPFVFAAWISKNQMDERFIQDFEIANEYGFKHLQEIVRMADNGVYDLMTYYTKNISYLLSEEKIKGMDLFLQMLK